MQVKEDWLVHIPRLVRKYQYILYDHNFIWKIGYEKAAGYIQVPPLALNLVTAFKKWLYARCDSSLVQLGTKLCHSIYSSDHPLTTAVTSSLYVFITCFRRIVYIQMYGLFLPLLNTPVQYKKRPRLLKTSSSILRECSQRLVRREQLKAAWTLWKPASL